MRIVGIVSTVAFAAILVFLALKLSPWGKKLCQCESANGSPDVTPENKPYKLGIVEPTSGGKKHVSFGALIP